MNRLLDYFQLASLALFLMLVLGRTLHIRLKQRVNPIRLSLRRNGVHRVITLLLFASVNLWVAATLLYVLRRDLRFPSALLSQPLFESIAVRSVGLALVVGGFVIFLISLAHLGDSWRLGIDEQTPGELVTWGIYALSRNPIYVFFDLYFLGTFLLNGTPTLFILAVLGATNLHLQILEEEKFLRATYGADYSAYCLRTGRYVTWPLLTRKAAPRSMRTSAMRNP